MLYFKFYFVIREMLESAKHIIAELKSHPEKKEQTAQGATRFHKVKVFPSFILSQILI